MKLEDANKLTLQEACDYAVQKIVEQGGRSLTPPNEYGTQPCAYGNSSGQHCAIGWLLDEDNDSMMFYRGGVHGLIKNYEETVPDVIKSNKKLFNDLQDFHDSKWKSCRRSSLNLLKERYSIDTSGEHWEQWVQMGA